jgi:uncharacterized protein
MKLDILGQEVFFDPASSSFSLRDDFDENERKSASAIVDFETVSFSQPSYYTFCLNVSDECNLRCDYCFNPEKSGTRLNSKEAISFLETLFSIFPNGEKYFVDLSGKGEPLLALKQVLEISDWCHQKQDEIRKEVLPQFVCNGTLLSPEIARVLQKHQILFGISIDGNSDVHNHHRKDQNNQATFDRIYVNIKGIENREYIGCATTLTKDVFPLLESVLFLSSLFKTLSYRPARGPFGFDEASEKLWEGEYDRLANRLLIDMKANDYRLFFCLMNGEDLFGHFLGEMFGAKRVLTRCDAGISRFAFDVSQEIYPCAAASKISTLRLKEGEDLSQISATTFKAEAQVCADCPFKLFCGGDCPIERSRLGGVNKVMCRFKQHLIALAAFIERTTVKENLPFAIGCQQFLFEKEKRFHRDEELNRFLEEHPNLSFTQAKALYDGEKRKY